MPKWSDFGNIWSTLREIDVSAIRVEAEKPFSIVSVGHPAAIDAIDKLLHTGDDRYGQVGLNPVEHIPFEQANEQSASIRSATLLVIAIDARAPLAQTDADALALVERASIPTLIALVFGTAPLGGVTLPRTLAPTTVILPDPAALNASDNLASAVFERLPSELHLAAARRLPGLRIPYTRDLVNTSSFTNATYALGTSLPEQIPVISVPFAIADIVVLTKNQALMVYRMALAHGAKPDFQERIMELAPVIGGGFVWRQLARTLVGLVPVWGVVPKVAIAYGGTYATGVAAWGWFARGEMLTKEQLNTITQQAIGIGRQRAKELADKAKQMTPGKKPGEPAQLPGPGAELPAPAGEKPGILQRIRSMLPGQKKPDQAIEDQSEK